MSKYENKKVEIDSGKLPKGNSNKSKGRSLNYSVPSHDSVPTAENIFEGIGDHTVRGKVPPKSKE